MPQSVLEMAKDLVMAQIEAGQVPSENMHEALQKTYALLRELKLKEQAGSPDALHATHTSPTPGAWQKSITKNTVTCLECGTTMKQLSRRHLADHGLDRQAYRIKYGIPRAQPLAAKSVTVLRKKIAQETKPWEKAPRYMKAQEGKAASQKANQKAKTRKRPRRRTTATKR